MAMYKLTSGKHSKDGKIYLVGEALELTNSEAKIIQHKVVPLTSSSSETLETVTDTTTTDELIVTTPTPSVSVEWETKLNNLSNTDAISLIKAQSSNEELNKAYEAEVSGRNRKTVLDAIERQRRG